MNEITPKNAAEIAKSALNPPDDGYHLLWYGVDYVIKLVAALVTRVEELETENATRTMHLPNTMVELLKQREAAVAILRRRKEEMKVRDYALLPSYAESLLEEALAALGADAKEPIPSND